MKRILIILAIAILCGCSESKRNVHAVPWQQNEITDHTFELDATNRVEVFSFGSNDIVSATIGTKQSLTGPVYYWHLNREGLLIINDDSERIILEKLGSNLNTVKVLRNGRPAIYIIK